MSLWKRISSHADCEARMAAYYDEKGLFDLRLCLAAWIEDRIMSEQITPNSAEQLERVALKFNEDLQQKLLSTRTASDQALKYRVVELCTQIQRTSALELYTHLRGGLQKELQLATEKSVATPGPSMPLSPYNMNNPAAMVAAGGGVGGGYMDSSELMSVQPALGGGLGVIHNAVGVNGGGNVTPIGMATAKVELYEIEHQILQYFNDFSTCGNSLKMLVQNYSYMLNSTGSPNAEEAFKCLMTEKAAIVTTLCRSYLCYEPLQELIISELNNWRRQQALAGNGAPFNESTLDQIQRCFELLESFIGHLLAAVKETLRVHIVNDEPELNNLLERVRSAQKNLVCAAFIVDKQPPQVMKTNTRFAASVRWLIGSQLGIHNNPPTIECIIMSENQANRFVTRGTQMDSTLAGQSSGEIQNCSSTMEYQQNNHIFSASFRNMQLKKIKRAEKKGTESVMDEKFALFFYATTTVNDYQIRVWTLSLPVVVIVHGNQEPQSWATITWDNAFADIVREPFMITDRVTWAQLSVALNTKFGSSTQRALTRDNLDFLYEKLQRDERSDYITWNQFCKEPLPDRPFTFWEWFFAIMKLTKDHLMGMWKASCIMGFINKVKAQDDLMRSATGIGTFLLRFSDSELGGVTIAYVNEYGSVTMLSPWTARDFQILNLADRIRDLNMLRWLHPSDTNAVPQERDRAFGEFYSPRTEPTPGYVRSTLHVQVRNTIGDNGSIIGTPQHPIPSPPQDSSMSMGNSGEFGMADFESMTNFVDVYKL